MSAAAVAAREAVATARPARPASAPAGATLRLGRADDPAEREADRIADAVLAGGALAGLPPPLPPPSGGVVRRACAACARDDDEGMVRRRTEGGAGAGAGSVPAAVHQAIAAPGQPLPAAERSYFAPRLGVELSGVRVHADAQAGASARAIDALAYTAGSHVVFAPGQWRPGTTDGRRLLAHELAHVAQGGAAVRRQQPPPAPAAGEACKKFTGKVVGKLPAQPIKVGTITVVYLIYAPWETGDSDDTWRDRAHRAWIPWRFGAQPGTPMFDELLKILANPKERVGGGGPPGTPGCWYATGIAQKMLNELRRVSGEAARDAAAAKAAPGGSGAAGGEQQAAGGKPGGQQSAGGGAAVVDADVQKEAREALEGYQATGLNLGIASETEAREKRPMTAVTRDWKVLADGVLAEHLLQLFEHYTARPLPEAEKAAAAKDGLTQAQAEAAIDKKPMRGAIAAVYMQAWNDWTRAGGKEDDHTGFFALADALIEQLVRGNPTAAHNDLRIGKAAPKAGDAEIIGIMDTAQGLLCYDASGLPLPGIGGVGMRDKGHVGARQPQGWGLNIAAVKEFDEGLFSLLNALRQSFGDPTRMAIEAAERLYDNIEEVKAQVLKHLSDDVKEMLKDSAPFLIGFLLGHGVSSWLLRTPNQVTIAIGAALKVLLKIAGYVMQIEAAGSTMQMLYKAAYHISRIEKDSDGKLTGLSKDHIALGAKPVSKMLADLAMVVGIKGLGKVGALIGSIRRGKARGRITCNTCSIADADAAPAKEPAKAADPVPPSGASPAQIARIEALLADAKKRKLDLDLAAMREYLKGQPDPKSLDNAIRTLEREVAGRSGIADAAKADVADMDAASGGQTQKAPAGTKAVPKQQSDIRGAHDLGVSGGSAQAAADGVRVLDWNNPRSWIGEYGRGLDGLGRRGKKWIILEFKGGDSPLSGDQMQGSWVGRKLAELTHENDPKGWQLLDAAKNGDLHGRTYRTKDLGGGKTETTLEGGEVNYSYADVLKAFTARLNELRAKK